MDLRTQETRAGLGRWLLAANLLTSAMALGALHTPVLAVVATVAALSAALLWYEAEPLRARPAATLLVVVGVSLVAWTIVQALPLPRGLVAAIASANADVWKRALAPLHDEGPGFVTISLDPVATRVQALRGTTYLLTFLAALRVAQRPEGVAFLERAIIGAGVAMGAAAFLHPVFGAQRVFGAYQPGEAYAYAPRHIAPLLNTNHLAAYANIGLFVALGAALRRRDALPRVLAVVAVVLLVATNLWAASRGGTASMVLGFVLVAGLTLATRRGRSDLRRFADVGAVGALVVGFGVVFILATDDAREELKDTDFSKLHLFKNTLDLLPRYGILGAGRGSFESVFPSVRTAGEHYVSTHPENIVLQWITEWGVPAGVAGLAAIAWALRPQTALARSQPPLGAWAALFVVAGHNLVDFSLEVPGVVVALAGCAGIVCGGTGGVTSQKSRLDRWSARLPAVALAGAALAVAGVAITLPFTSKELYNEQRTFKELGVDKTIAKDAFHEKVRAAILRHPAEAYFPFIGALRATTARDEPVLPWAAAALERSQVYGRAHLLIARTLYLRNPSQARLEYRLAVEQDSGLEFYVAKESLPLVSDFDDAMELVPAGASGVEALKGLVDGLAPRLPATAVRLDREILARSPAALDPLRREAMAALHDVTTPEPWCVPIKTCLEDGLKVAERVRDAQPGKCEGYEIVAELRVAAGDLTGLDVLERAIDATTDRSQCARKLVTLALAAKQSTRAEASVDRLTRVACDEAADCIDNLVFAAQFEAQRTNYRRALAYYKKAADRAPDRDDVLVTLATMARDQGLHGEALEAYRKLALRHPEDATWQAEMDKERTAVQSGIFERRPAAPSAAPSDTP
jgi:tetratricopeptide (TPR) repeat protein